MAEPPAGHPPGRGMPPAGLPVGTPVACRRTKWGGGRHWEFEGRYLGVDAHGHWWYAPAGTHCERPGAEFSAPDGWVSMVPHQGAYAVGFYPAHREIRVYVDMTTEPAWRQRDARGGGPEWEVTMVDLDLDVVLTREGRLFVDDEDEFAEHQVRLGYPPEIIALAEQWRDTVLAAVASGQEPFRSVGHDWLARADTQARGWYTGRGG